MILTTRKPFFKFLSSLIVLVFLFSSIEIFAKTKKSKQQPRLSIEIVNLLGEPNPFSPILHPLEITGNLDQVLTWDLSSQPPIRSSMNYAVWLIRITPSLEKMNTKGYERIFQRRNILNFKTGIGSSIHFSWKGRHWKGEKLSDGIYEIWVNAWSWNGQEQDAKRIEVTLDQTSPIIQLESPENDFTTGKDSIHIQGSLNEPVSGITLNGIQAQVNGLQFDGECPLSPGENKITIEAKDLAGNLGANSLNVTYDNIPPQAEFEPKEETLTTSQPELIFSYTDRESGINLETLTITLDGENITSTFSVTMDEARRTMDELSEGEHTWTASIQDKAGNETSLGGTFTIQTKEPLTVDNILSKIEKNYQTFQDMIAKTKLTLTYDGQIFGQPQYWITKLKRPDLERVESYTEENYQTLKDTSIHREGKIQIITPQGKKAMADLGKEAKLEAEQMGTMDLYFNLETFKSHHTISIIEGSYNEKEHTISLQVIPNETNPLYDRIDLKIDLAKGLIQEWDLYKNNTLVQTEKILESTHLSNTLWYPTKKEKSTPIDDKTFLVATLEYSDIKINSGLDPTLFEFQE